MSNQIRNRGRAYQCKRCPKVLRKGRMMSHILKHHVPLDRIPYSCTLCMFRCQDQQTLVDHITKYKRHEEAELKLGYKPNYSEVLRRSANPYTVGDNDMTQLDREESYRWHARTSTMVMDDTTDDLFQEEEEEEEDTVTIGGLTLPRWAVQDPPAAKIPKYVPTPIERLPQDRSGSTGLTIPMAQVTKPVETAFRSSVSGFGAENSAAAVLANSFPLTSTLSIPSATASVTRGYSNPSSSYVTISPKDWETATLQPSFHLTSTTTTATPIPSLQMTLDTNPSVLKTPVLTFSTPSRNVQTPCQDENILPGLLRQDETDPLLINPTIPSPISNKGEEDEEPLRKKARHEEKNQAMADLAKAITAGFEKVVMAIDSNTRMIRNQSQTLEKAVGEMSRIERKLNAIERSLTEKSRAKTSETATKENVPPSKTLKSVVKRV